MSNLDKTIETLTTKINLSIFRDGKFKISTSDQPLWEIKEHLSMEKIMNIQVYDNGGETFDRYTVIIDNDVFGMSENPLSASGFNQWCGDAYQLQTPHDYLGKDVTQEIFKDEIMVKAIVQRINQ